MKNTKQIQLSEHFSLREMTASGTAMQLNIDNTPDEAQTECLRNLCQQVLEPLRKRFGVIRVTSGFRSKRLNNAVGGVICSQHLLGEAADLHISNREVGERCMITSATTWISTSYCSNTEWQTDVFGYTSATPNAIPTATMHALSISKRLLAEGLRTINMLERQYARIVCQHCWTPVSHPFI